VRERPARPRILAAATRLFLERGYARTSMEAIAGAAGVSKATLYAHFRGKEELFAAIVEARIARLAEALDEDGGEPVPAERLRRFAHRFVGLVADPESLALYRLVIAEGDRFPALARIFWERGPARARAMTERILGELRSWPDDASRRLAAERLLALLLGPWLVRTLIGLERPDARFLDRWAAEGVEVFLRACGAGTDGAPTSR